MNQDLLKYEKELYQKGITLIAGVDEVGRGPLVGPVVAAGVILPQNYSLPGLNDSKKLSAKKRATLFPVIMQEAISVGIGVVDHQVIDQINIYEASRLAMMKAIADLKVAPEYILTDAMPLKNISIPFQSIIHGDALSASIAAASIIAKVTRDAYMKRLGQKYPAYGFERHVGYGTK